jgi:hypothetical protein
MSEQKITNTTDTPPAVPATPDAAAPAKPKRPLSEARLRANREYAKNSSGPRTDEGKRRSSLNATRHGILSQVIHLPEEDLAAYDEFACAYVADLKPVGVVETQLANACADLQFRLHRIAASEHNLFALGHEENGDAWDPGHPEAHTALTLVESMRRSKDPLHTLSTYEQRLSRRFLQTMKQLREIQTERRALEQQQLEEMYRIAVNRPDSAHLLKPATFGFVCSDHDWQLFRERRLLLSYELHTTRPQKMRRSIRQILKKAA